MKKLLALVLLLCLVCTSAFAAGNLERTETRVVRDAKDNGKYDINVFIQVKNTGDAPVGLDTAKIYLYDSNNAVLKDSSSYSMYPSVLQPGEVGYIYNQVYSAEASLATAIASYTIMITPETDARYMDQIAHLTHEGVYEEVPYYGSTNAVITFNITNEYTDTLWEAKMVAVIRSTEGKILDVSTTTAYNVGIPAGSTILYEMDLGSSDLEKWTSSGHTVGSVESFVYVDLD